MASVVRNGDPPKNHPYKIVMEFGDWQYSEEQVSNWLRNHCSGRTQYDILKFQGSNSIVGKTIRLTIWFQKKADQTCFQQAWIHE